MSDKDKMSIEEYVEAMRDTARAGVSWDDIACAVQDARRADASGEAMWLQRIVVALADKHVHLSDENASLRAEGRSVAYEQDLAAVRRQLVAAESDRDRLRAERDECVALIAVMVDFADPNESCTCAAIDLLAKLRTP